MLLGGTLGSTRTAELIFLINKLTWDQLHFELDEPALTQIIERLKVLLDRRDYLVGFLLRWFFLVENEALERIDLNVLASFASSRTAEVRHSFADQSLNQRDAVLDGIAQMGLRQRATNFREYKQALDSVAGSELYRALELQQLSWEVFYTDRICTELGRGEYKLLLTTLADLFNDRNPQFPIPNIALFNMLRRWERHFVAMEGIIELLGDVRQNADFKRFMNARRNFMDNFPPVPPSSPGAFLAAIQQAIQNLSEVVANTFEDLKDAVQAVATTINNFNAPQLFGSSDDNKARNVVNSMSGAGGLAFLPTDYKVELNNRMLESSIVDGVLDDDELAILTVLRETKTRSPAEFLQLAQSATWETLDSRFHGAEVDQLKELFKF